MKTKFLKIAVMSGIVVFGLFSCAHPDVKEIEYPEKITQRDSSDLVKTNKLLNKERADDLLDYIDHNAVIDARYIQNAEALNEMRNESKSEVNAVQMKYDQGLYELNKMNLEIKTKVNDHVIQDKKSWADFKTSTNREMNSLEKSIRDLAE
ncbi:hypothetical protein [Aquiflexum sp.]|uniref:hypothetical protein n=1 Tax=Aquiflexum sp. TaxID=1872584 RepID=UPI0035943B7A